MQVTSTFKRGMIVRIIDIKTTHRRHSSCSEMDAMVGKQYKIKEVGSSAIRIGEFNWAPEDIEPLDIVKSPKVYMKKVEEFSFDVNTLINGV